MNFFEINSPNKEIKIHTQLLKEFFSNTGTNINDDLFFKSIVFNFLFNELIITFCSTSGGKTMLTLDQWNIIEDNLHHLYLKSKVFTYSINTPKNSIELVFDAEIGMISEN